MASIGGRGMMRVWLPSVPLVAAVLAISPAVAEERSINLLDDALIESGSELFQMNCAVGYCHGSEGRSARGPALRDREWAARDLHRITHDGLSGTSMPAWKSVLSTEEIWAVTAYIMTLARNPVETANALVSIEADAEGPRELTGAAKHGEELFFDLTRERRCGLCHRLGDKGTAVGPNLAVVAGEKTAEDLKRDIRQPGKLRAFGFELTEVSTRDGEVIRGVLADQSPAGVKIYDTSVLPPVLRTVPARALRRVRARNGRSPMPEGWESVYSDAEIGAIVAFLMAM